MDRHARQAQHGVTLPELVITLAVAAILLSIAAPSFAALFTRLRVQGASAEFGTDLHYARTEALRLRSTVTVTSNATSDGYTITAGGNTLKTVTLPNGVNVTPSLAISYDPVRALASPAAQTYLFQSTAGDVQLRVSSNLMGRVQMCVPTGFVAGYPAC